MTALTPRARATPKTVPAPRLLSLETAESRVQAASADLSEFSGHGRGKSQAPPYFVAAGMWAAIIWGVFAWLS